jgi:hypothetical protein
MTIVRPFGGGGKYWARTRAGSAAETAASNSDRSKTFGSTDILRKPPFYLFYKLIIAKRDAADRGGRFSRSSPASTAASRRQIV